MLRRFDEVARWVSTSILAAPRLKQRAKVLQRFIRIADVSELFYASSCM